MTRPIDPAREHQEPHGTPSTDDKFGPELNSGAGNKAGPESAGNTPEALTTDSTPTYLGGSDG